VRTALLAAVLLLGSGARAAEPEPENFKLRACVKWSKDVPEAVAAGAGLFAATQRVEGDGPHPACDVVAVTEAFGVGWLMRAWMKEGVYSPCGERVGGYTIRYKGEQWQMKIVQGLDKFLEKNPKALKDAKKCPEPAAPPVGAPAVEPPVQISTAPLTPPPSAESVVPSTAPAR
jgi:hypothetical protein